jgi:hypothetical protein|tara:strand:+ start:613 stop:738 length:126 start_codon:yes stop_codon:yes gene_type:complete
MINEERTLAWAQSRLMLGSNSNPAVPIFASDESRVFVKLMS